MNTLVLKILILGGTNFLGPHFVEEIQERGHEVTLFNRGTKNASQFPGVEQLYGDRDGSLEALEGREWDAVIDTCGYVPRVVEASSKVLFDTTNHYTFISSINVYENFHQFGIDEEYPLAQLEDPINEEITEKTYGPLKAACEQVVQHYFPDNSLIIRPGLIVGPYDHTDRFTYWPCRIKEGGDVLAPGDPTRTVQFIDVRDLAKWTVDMIEAQATGAYNATGESIAFEALLNECQKVTQVDVRLHWVSESFLIEHQVQDWIELPLWLSSERNMPGLLSVNNERAVKAGLVFRPLPETLTAILDWNEQRENTDRRAGLSREKEEKLLKLWYETK